jgi:hypothetical protein
MCKCQPASSYPRARGNLTVRPIGGLFALTDRAGIWAERLTPLAALVWTYCDRRHSPAAIAEAAAASRPKRAKMPRLGWRRSWPNSRAAAYWADRPVAPMTTIGPPDREGLSSYAPTGAQ